MELEIGLRLWGKWRENFGFCEMEEVSDIWWWIWVSFLDEMVR